MLAAATASAAPAAKCDGVNNFGVWGYQCQVADGRSICTMQLNQPGPQGLRIVTRTITAKDDEQLYKVQAILMLAADQFAFSQGQRPAVTLQLGAHGRPNNVTGTATAPKVVGIKSGIDDLSIWIVGDKGPATIRAKVGATPLTFTFPHADYIGALNGMTGCQIAYLKKNKLY